MENIQLGGTEKINPNSPAVQRAIGSSVRIVDTPSSNSGQVTESGHLVDLSPAQMQALGLKPNDQVVLTDAHGVERAHGEIFVQGSNDAWYAARMVKLDDVRDLAYLKVENLPPGVLPHVTIAQSDDLSPGEMVFSVGHVGDSSTISVNGTDYLGKTTKNAELKRLGAVTGTGDQYDTEYQGIINKLGALDGNDVSVDFNRPLNATPHIDALGTSGGGLFNSKGELVSVLEAIENTPAQGRDLYTPLNQIQAFQNEPQKFNFNYGTQPYQFSQSSPVINAPYLNSVQRTDGTNRPPMSIEELVESKLTQNH
jgi:S1-C subfamily serine protease